MPGFLAAVILLRLQFGRGVVRKPGGESVAIAPISRFPTSVSLFPIFQRRNLLRQTETPKFVARF